ncbi:hypothetical protein FUAX_43120 (plasmid) [Fulvitalea axinellae]|uniref:WD40 repeat domain-containing protein n=1 Tax=Fulvitalea axinellae TaxID=1182444 RepID=A0AAU9DH48_9BACT|nr:hypothetical protein FUAX_43120 [Fulvitalea axinellae]
MNCYTKYIKVVIAFLIVFATNSKAQAQVWEKDKIVFPEREKVKVANTGKSIDILDEYAVAVTDGGIVVWKLSGNEWKIQARLGLPDKPKARFESVKIESEYIAGLYKGDLYLFDKKNGEWSDSQEAVKVEAPLGSIRGNGFDIASNTLAYITFNTETESRNVIALIKRPNGGWASASSLQPKHVETENPIWRIALTDDILCATSFGTENKLHIFENNGNDWNSSSLFEQVYISENTEDHKPSGLGYAIAVHQQSIVALDGKTGYIHLFQKASGSWPDMEEVDTKLLRPKSLVAIKNDYPVVDLDFKTNRIAITYWNNEKISVLTDLFEASGDTWERTDPRMIWENWIENHAGIGFFGNFETNVAIGNDIVAVYIDGEKNVPADFENLNFYKKETFWPKAVKMSYEKPGPLRTTTHSQSPWLESRLPAVAFQGDLCAMPVRHRKRQSVGIYDISGEKRKPLAYLSTDRPDFFPEEIIFEEGRLFVLSKDRSNDGLLVYVFEKKGNDWISTRKADALVEIGNGDNPNAKGKIRFLENRLEVWDGKELYSFRKDGYKWVPANDSQTLEIGETDFIADKFSWNRTEVARLILTENESRIYAFQKNGQRYSDTPVMVGNLSGEKKLSPKTNFSIADNGTITVTSGSDVFLYSKQQEGGYKKATVSVDNYVNDAEKVNVLSALVKGNNLFVTYKAYRLGESIVEAIVLTKGGSEGWETNLSNTMLIEGKADTDLLKTARIITDFQSEENKVILFDRFYSDSENMKSKEAFILFKGQE